MTIKEDFATSASDKERLDLAIKHFGCESGTVHRISDDGSCLLFSAASDGMPPVVLEKIQSIPVGKGMAGLCYERNEAIDTCNLQTDTSGDVQPGAKATGLHGTVVAPIRNTDGKPVGTFGIGTTKDRTFIPEEVAEIQELANMLA
jgi:L-methionine (R)-S-oxide reductase